jgi:hypothetical protein
VEVIGPNRTKPLLDAHNTFRSRIFAANMHQLVSVVHHALASAPLPRF